MAEYRNPNQQGSQDSRPLLVMMLVMLLSYTGFRLWESQHTPPPPAAVAQSTQKAVAGPAPVVPGASASTPAAPAPASALPVIAATAETTTTIENELYKITFSNRGAQVTSWILKRHMDNQGKAPLDLVNHQAAKIFGYPLSLYTYDPVVTAGLANALYVPSATGALTAPANLTFQYQSGEFQVTKTFSFDQTYVLHAETKVLRNGVPVRALLAWPGGFGDQDNASAYMNDQIDSSSDGKEDHLATKKVSGGDTLRGPFDWAGVSDLYFAAIFLPDSPGSASLITLDHSLDVPKGVGGSRSGNGSAAQPDAQGHVETVKVPLLGAAMGDLSGDSRVSIFAGPKAVDVLKNIHAENPKVTLQPLLDFGFFGIIGKYLFLALRAIHEHVTPSWGWSIVILTILINLLILPLRIKTMQSGLKMQRIQPQIDAIKAKYKNPKMNDPKFNEMNAEIQQFTRDSGVNMFGGCVPTLITMPLLFAFFGMLPKVVELRQAHWYWLPDLSAADPYHILPILMMVSQFLVQFYTPSPGVDPAQQRMMAFTMPMISGYMTWRYSSGLALYWSVGNLISIAQQAVMNRTSLGREMREIAAKRARRKAGTGVGRGTPVKTIQGKTVKRR